MTRIAHTRSRELFTLSVLAIALGIAVGSAAVFSVSMALGAFAAHALRGRLPEGMLSVFQTGVQYATMDDSKNDGGEYEGWQVVSGIRISW